MEPRGQATLRMVGNGYSVLIGTVERLATGASGDLYTGRTPGGLTLFFIEGARCRWLLGENQDITLEGFQRFGRAREDLLTSMALYSDHPGVSASIGRIARMLTPQALRDCQPTAHGCTTSPGLG